MMKMEIGARTLLQFLMLSLLCARCCAQVFNLSLSVEEGLPEHTVVGDMRAALPENTTRSTGFIISESKDSDVFRDLEIDGDTGIISTAVPLDRERTARYEFAAATLTGELIKVTINVKDVNDHSPVFPAQTVLLNVSEFSPPGSRFELHGAQDQDEGEYGIQGYRITDGDMMKLFKVEFRNGGGNMFNLDLILQAQLDRETTDFYSLSVEAFDGGIPPKTGQLQVHVTVLDENDNQPVFNQSEYLAFLRESAPLLTPACQVFATDPDLGTNGQVTYEINRKSDPNEFFIIDNTSGIIRLNKPLDYENQSLFELIVTAWDCGTQPESFSTFVVIKVIDVNDNSPDINILFLNEAGAPVVSEGAGYGEYVARVAVSDPDLGDVNRIDVFLKGGDGVFTLKPIDDFLYVLCVDGPLDREEKDLYELTMIASDFGSPPLRTEKKFHIQVLDVNDNPPLFEQNTYERSVPEDVPEGTALFWVKATDKDEGESSEIMYSIQSDQKDLLNIDPISGLITTTAGLDHETATELRFLVVAADGGYPSLSTTTTVTMHVEDVNDNKPIFKQQFYNVTIKEHTVVGTCFLQVTAVDADEFGSVWYSLYDEYRSKDTHSLFHVNSHTGEICVSQDIDREAGLETFDLLIKAEDQEGLSSQSFVHIDVEDVNDNAPVFSPDNYVTSVSTHAQLGTEILSVCAFDRDAGSYGQISYELLPGDSASLFTLDQSTGTVFLSSSLSQLRSTSVKLSVSARDGGGRSATLPANITVNVLHSGQPPVLFQKSHYTFSISEDAPVGSSVGVVQTVTPANSVEVVSFVISSGDPQGLFSVASHTGLITTNQPLDHESLRNVLLTLQFHTGALPIYSSAQVNISITDVNDNPPVFSKTSEHITISRNTPSGTPIFIAHAHDSDSDVNGRIQYALLPQSQLFTIHPRLGMLTLSSDLPRDSSQRFEFSIIAEDEGHPSLSSTLSLVIDIDSSTRVEDMLAFETLVYQVQIGESAPKDTAVIQVRAHGTKAQRGPSTASPVIFYSLKSLTEIPPFRVHPETGWMFVSQSLDYETNPTYSFIVLATVRDAETEITAMATVIVMVQDENDNAPVFTRDVYFFSVQEGPSPHGLIGTVKATDIDSDNNGLLSYILLSDGKYFRINSRTGEIINLVALDREEQVEHTLRVMVTDQGQPRLNTTTTVHILVTDINDNCPQFTNLPATKEINVQVWTGIPVGSVVITMFAKDLDAGENGSVVFTMKDNELGHFDIDSRNGDIKVTSRFSTNPQTHYTLRVIATDSGHFPLEETAVIQIQVYADKQNRRSDFHGLRHFAIQEDVRLGTVIGSLEIFEAPNEQLRYSIAEGDGSFQFGIKSSSGDLYVAQHLDYEVTQRYFLVVRAEAPPTFNATLLVAVSVVDVNDHAPWFPYNDNVVVFGVHEDVDNGTVVYVFNARDADGSLENSELDYTLIYEPDSAEEEQPFRIDPHTGVVTTSTVLDRERTESIVFKVTASDMTEEPNSRKQASVIAQAILLDVNDNRPSFISKNTASVSEDAEVGLLVHHVIAKDEDEGNNGHIIYSLISGNEKGFFHMQITGHLYLNSSLDYESDNLYILTLQAADSGLPSLSSTQTLTVEVLDVNDHPPVFQQLVYNSTVMENREAGEIIITVTAVDLDSEINAAVSYSLLPSPGYELFTINSDTGQISTSTRLDREIRSRFTLRVQAEDSGTPSLSSTATILCSVLDDNDNTPEFSQHVFQLIIPENLPPGIIHTVQASDADNGLNGTIQYSIEGPECFSIDAVTGAISTTRVLDREEQSNYTLLVTAADCGHPPLSSTALLHISLSDENDNSPSFSRKNFRTTVSEGLAAGSEVLHLIARDPDEGPNGAVTFSLVDDSSGNFYVDASTGVILLTKPLDRETRTQHVFHAVATDSCSQGPRSSIAVVTIQVEDINDNPPSCNKEPMRVSVFSVNTRPHQPIATVTADDPDQGDNGTVVFSLTEEDELFQVDGSSGVIRLKAPLSDEVSGTKLLHVQAADLGLPPLTSTCLLLVQLNGQEPPLKFTEEIYEVTMLENSNTGSWVANVVAHVQTGDEGTIKYNIFSGNENEAFSINPSTGDITVRNQRLLDFEVQRKVHLVVLAENGHQTAYARVTITLQDVNDNKPVFKQRYYRTAVWEGQIHNTYVMQVLATDSDSGVNGQISYFIVEGNHNNAFVIDSVRGILATNTVLDREIVSSYKLILQAKDMGSPSLTGTCTVHVQVIDVNDNSPTIPPMEAVVIAENLPVGYIVTQVLANDVDLGPAATYRFTEKNETGGSFAIDHYTGVITTTRSLDFEEQAVHTLRVEASDSVHQTETEVSIQVLDVNDNPPVFSQESYQVVLAEWTPADSYVVTVSATDRDSGLNGKISYRLLSSLVKGFYIDAENGSVFTEVPLKYVANGNILRLLVEARDSGDPNLFSLTSVDIEVVDSNDHAPCFTQNSYKVSVAEDAAIGSTLLTLSAEDKDYSNQNSNLKYKISGGNDERRFCLDVVSIATDAHRQTVGQVVVCDTLDRETTDSYSLTVTVMDRGTPPLNSSTMVSIKVLDINDHAPVFSSQEYHAQVSENSPLGTVLIQVFAHDSDLGANRTVKYTIISGNSRGLIRLDPATGVLEVNGTLDYEEDPKFTLTIQASDGGGPSGRKVSFAVVYILVLDENDNSPFFMFPTISCSVAENLPAFTSVCTVRAVDRDAGNFGLLTYSIVTSCFLDYDSNNPGKKEAFAIDPLTGEIHTKQTFDYEGESNYCFVVEARDKGDQIATLRVQIEIEGIDEFSPIFTQQVYHFSLPDNGNVGQSIGHVMAMDYDGGLDGLVEYSLVNPSPFLSVNKTTGSIYISSPVYQKRSTISQETIENLLVVASSPKLDSRSSTCHVLVNISNSAKALTSATFSVQIASLSVALIVFLLLLISFIALVLRYKSKENTVKKATSLAANLNHGADTSEQRDRYNRISDINLHDLQAPLDMWPKVDIPIPFRNSDSSGRGSAEETAEDQEIKMINKFPYFKQHGSAATQQTSIVSDSGIPADSDQLSCHSADEDHTCGANVGIVQIVDMPSSESLHNFKEEGGGEGMLPRVVNMREVEEVMRRCMSMRDDQGSVKGSLTNLISPEEQLNGSYSWDYLLDWQPQFQSMASVFTDIGMLPDEDMRARDIEPESQSLLHPPPLITAVAQPGIRNVPPRMPQRREIQVRQPTYPKYTYSPHMRNTGLTPSAMTPSFSPSLSLLTMRTPNTSPVVSETGLGRYTKIATLPIDTLEDTEIQV